MKSGFYIAIFVIFVVIIGGFILYNAKTIDNIDDNVVTIKKTIIKDQDETIVVQQKINVLTDVDFEMDESDLYDGAGLDEFDNIEFFEEDDLIVFN